LKGEDKDAIEAKSTALMTASQKLGEMMYAKMQEETAAAGGGAAGAAGGPGAGAQAGASEAKQDDVVDADFKEVKRG
jgi:molecular chaperone DnaK